jgi:hypothetical protein
MMHNNTVQDTIFKDLLLQLDTITITLGYELGSHGYAVLS